MPYDTRLEEKIEEIASQLNGLERKKMFGGIGYLLNGNMCFGVFKDYLIVRMSADLAAGKLQDKNLRAFGILSIFTPPSWFLT